MDRNIKKKIRLEINDLLDIKNRTPEQESRMKLLGDMLFGKVPYREVVKMEFSKEVYQDLKTQGKTDVEIMEICNVDGNKVYRSKREWGLIGQRVNKEKVEKKVISIEKYNQLSDDFETLKGNYQHLNNHFQELIQQEQEKYNDLKVSYDTLNQNHESIKKAYAKQTEYIQKRVQTGQNETELRNEINTLRDANDLLKTKIKEYETFLKQDWENVVDHNRELKKRNKALAEALKVVL